MQYSPGYIHSFTGNMLDTSFSLSSHQIEWRQRENINRMNNAKLTLGCKADPMFCLTKQSKSKSNTSICRLKLHTLVCQYMHIFAGHPVWLWCAMRNHFNETDLIAILKKSWKEKERKIDRIINFWSKMSNIRNIEFVGVYDIQMRIIERVELLRGQKWR